MNINIKRFSRSKVDKPEEPEVKRPRGRPKKNTSVEPEAPPSPKPEPEPESLYEEDSVSEISEDNNINQDDDFLADLNNVNFREPPTKEEIKEKEKTEKERKQREKENNKFLKTASRLDLDSIFKRAKAQSVPKTPKPQKSQYEDDNSLFDDKGTELLGRDKRMLLSKIQQYKRLFPEELGKFKIKKKNKHDVDMLNIVDLFSKSVTRVTVSTDEFLIFTYTVFRILSGLLTYETFIKFEKNTYFMIVEKSKGG
jgi:hypothetical protein